jgi:hypothetical protein|tara:strand:+ start:69 stop:188 length:120 start_codon:yes stop_codon:yes gene_type:complete
MGLFKYEKEREKARLAEKTKRIKKAKFEGEKAYSTRHNK